MAKLPLPFVVQVTVPVGVKVPEPRTTVATQVMVEPYSDHRGARAAVDTGGGADDRNRVGHRDLHGIDVGNSIVGTVRGKRHAEVAVIDIRRRPGGAPQIIVCTVSGSRVG